jgi:hypothetical protein
VGTNDTFDLHAHTDANTHIRNVLETNIYRYTHTHMHAYVYSM